ncbi:PspC domain-containing protein [Plantactinospora sp. WMMB334]|uniref:PspC domain-containing protein n=1 Tax=Plantactinospora sp. WMMB334 TaxID=3404119 RepID=UPI003B93B03C
MTDDAAARGTPGPVGGPARADSPDLAQERPGVPDPGVAGPPPAEPQDSPPSATAWPPPPGDIPPPGAGEPPPPGAGGPPPPGGPPPGGPMPPGAGGPPPPGGGPEFGFAYRYNLVRPREGRYLAGVCAAIGRATNSDPILWRVLLAVLGFFGGIGILVYLAAWLIIPSEGDSASPVESMLGRGRSSMSPVTVLVLGIIVAVLFGFIVTDTFRAVLLGAAVLITGALLLNRDRDRGRAGAYWQPGTAPPPPPGYPPPGTGYPVPPGTGPGHPGWYPPAAQPPAAPGYPPGAATATAPPPPAPGWAAPGWPAVPPAVAPHGPQPAVPPVPGGYRAPFAPHGPYATARPVPPPPPPPKVKEPKRPRERSALGGATFSMIFVAIGLVAILDLTNAIRIAPSTYFAAVLVTIAIGLLVGVWFGRARWLIALGLVAASALGISTVAESQTRFQHEEDVLWAPASYAVLADRYETRLGRATLDLTRIDFTDQDARVSVDVDLGEVKVILPPTVDVTVRLDVDAGDALVLDHRYGHFNGSPREVTDLGEDGAGGGKLLLDLSVDAGTAEVTR